MQLKFQKTNFIYFKNFELGKGSYGNVYYGLNTKTKQEVAVKLYSEKSDEIKVDFECCLCKDYETLSLSPKIYYFSFADKICVQSLLGPNLETLYNFCKRKFCIKTISYIGIELINAIEDLHNIGFIHRDIKPKNIVWLNFSDYQSIAKNNLILIDFGLAGPYVSKDNSHLPFIEKYGLIGTQYYSSVNSTRGNSQSRRDDIEAIFNCLVFFFKGKLPWEPPQNLKEYNISKDNNTSSFNKDKIISQSYKDEIKRILKIKETIEPSIFCKDMPNEFKVIYCYIKNLSYEEMPDYNIIRLLLRNVIESKKKTVKKIDRNKFIWEKKIKEMLTSKKSDETKIKEINNLFPGYPLNIKKLMDLLIK